MTRACLAWRSEVRVAHLDEGPGSARFPDCRALCGRCQRPVPPMNDIITDTAARWGDRISGSVSMGRARTHPGVMLRAELDARGMSAHRLALAIRVPANRVTAILRGDRAVTAETAVRLGRYLGTGPEFWMTLQSAYDIATVNREKGGGDRERGARGRRHVLIRGAAVRALAACPFSGRGASTPVGHRVVAIAVASSKHSSRILRRVRVVLACRSMLSGRSCNTPRRSTAVSCVMAWASISFQSRL